MFEDTDALLNVNENITAHTICALFTLSKWTNCCKNHFNTVIVDFTLGEKMLKNLKWSWARMKCLRKT